MSDDQLDDLKQFVKATVSQSEERLSGEIGELRQEMQAGFAGVGDAIEQIHGENTLTDTRLTRLEDAAA